MIVGVDVSSYRVDLAWMDAQGRPCRWHQDLGKGHLIDRLRRLRVEWPTSVDDVTDIAIEYPFGRGPAIAALMAVVGIVTRQAPPWARVAWPSSGELRAAIGARNTKASAHHVIGTGPIPWFMEIGEWDEHEKDALVACLGWTAILNEQERE